MFAGREWVQHERVDLLNTMQHATSNKGLVNNADSLQLQEMLALFLY